jgi:hypothetical protein
LKKAQYRCSRCLILEERTLFNDMVPLCAVPCHKCEGMAVLLPASSSMEDILRDIGEKHIDEILCPL